MSDQPCYLVKQLCPHWIVTAELNYNPMDKINDLESQLAAAQERVRELEEENRKLHDDFRIQLNEIVRAHDEIARLQGLLAECENIARSAGRSTASEEDFTEIVTIASRRNAK